VACSLALIAVLFRNNRLLRRANDEVRLLIGDLRRTGSDRGGRLRRDSVSSLISGASASWCCSALRSGCHAGRA
jgi:hypothetical protein